MKSGFMDEKEVMTVLGSPRCPTRRFEGGGWRDGSLGIFRPLDDFSIELMQFLNIEKPLNLKACLNF